MTAETVTLILAGLDTLKSRSDQLTKRFFKRSVLPESSCLHYLLPERREASVTDRLCRAWTFEPQTIRTVKYRTLLSHIGYQISIKCVCVPGHIFSAFISHVSCIVV